MTSRTENPLIIPTCVVPIPTNTYILHKILPRPTCGSTSHSLSPFVQIPIHSHSRVLSNLKCCTDFHPLSLVLQNPIPISLGVMTYLQLSSPAQASTRSTKSCPLLPGSQHHISSHLPQHYQFSLVIQAPTHFHPFFCFVFLQSPTQSCQLHIVPPLSPDSWNAFTYHLAHGIPSILIWFTSKHQFSCYTSPHLLYSNPPATTCYTE